MLDDYRAEQVPALLRQKTNELATQAKRRTIWPRPPRSWRDGENQRPGRRNRAGARTRRRWAKWLRSSSTWLPGKISGPINAGRTGVVAKLVDKQEPSADEIAKNFDQTRDQILDQRRGEAFQVFASNIIDDYKKTWRVLFNASRKTRKYPANRSHSQRLQRACIPTLNAGPYVMFWLDKFATADEWRYLARR